MKYNRRTIGITLEIALKKLKEEVEKTNRDIFYLTIDY